MRPIGVVVLEILRQDPGKVCLTENDDVIEAFPADRANDTLGERVCLHHQMHPVETVRHECSV